MRNLPPPPPPPTPAAGAPPQRVLPEGTMVITMADGKPIEAIVTKTVDQGVARVEAILKSDPPVPEQPQKKSPQEKPFQEKELKSEQNPTTQLPVKDTSQPAPSPAEKKTLFDPLVEKIAKLDPDKESSHKKVEPVEAPQAVNKKVAEEPPREKPDPEAIDERQIEPKPTVEDVDPPSENQIEEDPQPMPQFPANEEPEEMPPVVERKAEPEPEPEPENRLESEPEPEPEPEPVVEKVEETLPEEEPPAEEHLAEDVETAGEPNVEEPPPSEDCPVEEAPAEESPVEEPPTEEPPTEEPLIEEEKHVTPVSMPKPLKRKRDVVRDKAVPKFPIKLIAGKEIAAVTIFLMKEKARGNDINPQLDALMKGG